MFATDPINPQILVIAPPGRKRETLLSMMRSLRNDLSVSILDTCLQAKEIWKVLFPSLIFIDFRKPDHENNDLIAEFCFFNPEVQIILLSNRARQPEDFTLRHVKELIYDDLSIPMLEQLIKGNKP